MTIRGHLIYLSANDANQTNGIRTRYISTTEFSESQKASALNNKKKTTNTIKTNY